MTSILHNAVDARRTNRSPVTDLTAELEKLHRLAAAVLNEHLNQAGLCAVCGCAFPCSRAVLAEHTAAAL
jgi:hypothetical protein